LTDCEAIKRTISINLHTHYPHT